MSNIKYLLLNSKNSKDFISRWSYKFPYDKWWRERHNIAFLSDAHLSSNFWANKMEYLEEVEHLKAVNEIKNKNKNNSEEATGQKEAKDEDFANFDDLQNIIDKK